MDKPRELNTLDVLAFFCELAMVVLLVFAGHGLVGGIPGWIIGGILALMAIGIWSQWMAPKSARRLPLRQRRLAQMALFAATALYAAAGGLVWWGLGFLLASTTVFTIRRD